MYEKTLHELAAREPDVAFPNRGFRIIGNGTALPSGILDLLAVDPTGQTWVIELKRNGLGRTAVDQVLGYLSELIERSPDVTYRAMVAGRSCSTDVREYALQNDVVVHIFDMDEMTDLGRRLGVRDMAAAPRRMGSAKRESKIRGPGKRLANSGLQVERQRVQRELDEAFPPGTLTHGVTAQTLETYWQRACPYATPETIALTVTITLHVLDQARGTALSNRASSWTTIRYPDGRLCAAVEATKRGADFDFLLPANLVDEFLHAGMGHSKQARMGGVWCQVRGLGRTVSVEDAIGWFDRGIRADYQ